MDTQRLILLVIFSFSLLMLWEAWEKEKRPKPPPTAPTVFNTPSSVTRSRRCPRVPAEPRAGTAIGGSDSMQLFLRASDIVRAVPVYRLHVARDFTQLPGVVEQIRTWHSAARTSDAVS